MTKLFHKLVIAAVLVVPLGLGLAAGTAAAAPTSVALQVPVVTGPEIGPGGVPGGMFQTVSIVATGGIQPGAVTFSVPALAPYHYQYNYRWVTVHWRNLQTGASGNVDLRHWIDAGNVADKSYAAKLPTQASVVTGAGPIVATVSHQREQYKAPPMSNAIVPGFGILAVS